MSKATRKGGWPKRTLVPLQIKLPPAVADALTRMAREAVPPVSRMHLIEKILTEAAGYQPTTKGAR